MIDALKRCFSWKFLVFSSPLVDIILPSTFQANFIIPLWDGYSFFLFDIISIISIIICLYKYTFISKKEIVLYLCLLYFFIVLLFSAVYSFDNLFLKLYYCLDFVYWGIVLSIIKYTNKEFRLIIRIFLFVFLYLCLQVHLTSFRVIDYEFDRSFQAGVFYRGVTTIGTSTISGHYLYILLVVLFSYYNKWKYVLLLVGIISIYLTFTRGAIAAVALFVLYIFYRRLSFYGMKKNLIFVAFSVLLFFALNSKFDFIGSMQSRMEISASYSAGDYSAGRFERWSNLTNSLDNNGSLLFGLGLGTTPMRRTECGGDVDVRYSPHNVYLGVLGETGLIILSVFILILIFVLKRIVLTNKFLFAGLFVFFSISYMTELVTYTSIFSVLVWLVYYNIGNYYINRV